MVEIDLRFLRAAVALAEDLNYSRAASRLHLTQPALTKQIQDLEGLLGVPVFNRDRRSVELTDAGRAFVEEARLCLLHHDRAVQAARSAAAGAEAVLHIGQSPSIDPVLTSIVSSVRLPLFPTLRLNFFSDHSPELTRRVAVGELNLALVTAAPEVPQLAYFELSSAPFYALLEEGSRLCDWDEVGLEDLAGSPWALVAPQVTSSLYERLMKKAAQLGVEPTETHFVSNAEQAALLVQKTGAIGILTRHEAWRVALDGLTMRPLKEPELMARTVLATRLNSGRLVSEFVRAVMKSVQSLSAPKQGKLPLVV